MLTISESETFYYWQEGGNSEERCSFLHFLCHDSASPPRDDTIDLAKDIR